jgi:hypothetical protein
MNAETKSIEANAVGEPVVGELPTTPPPSAPVSGSGADGYKVLLRCNATGEERWAVMGGVWDEAAEFMWTEGNFGCDCNRHLFFERAAGRETAEDRKCGEDAYFAICVELPDGTRHDLDEPPNIELRGEEKSNSLE